MLYISGLLCFFLYLPLFILASNLDYDNWLTIQLEHKLKANKFSYRGNITIPSLRIGQSTINQNPLTEEESLIIQSLSKLNKDYVLKSTVITKDGKSNTFQSTIKACMLAESELDDRISVFLDYAGRVIGVSLVIASKSTCEGIYVPLEKLNFFTTNVYVRYTEPGPMPDTATYIQKLEREREAKESSIKDNRSFFAKYWMYILPVVIFVMVMAHPITPEAPAGVRSN